MQIADYKKAIFWRAIAATTAVDVGLAAVAGWYTAKYESGEFWPGFLIVIALLWVIGIIAAIRRGLGTWLLSFMTKEDFLIGAALSDLRRFKIPPPTDWDSKNLEYLAHVAGSPDFSGEDRARAATLYANAKAQISNMGVFRGMIVEMAYDKAVEAYFRESPKREKAWENDE